MPLNVSVYENVIYVVQRKGFQKYFRMGTFIDRTHRKLQSHLK